MDFKNVELFKMLNFGNEYSELQKYCISQLFQLNTNENFTTWSFTVLQKSLKESRWGCKTCSVGQIMHAEPTQICPTDLEVGPAK